MSVQLNKINVNSVEIGMYIFKLDRPWAHTPFFAFADEGFYVRDKNEIKNLKANCNYVFVDPQKGIAPQDNAVLGSEELPDPNFRGKLRPLKVDSSIYVQVTPLSQEMSHAVSLYDKMLDEMEVLFDSLKTNSLKTNVPSNITEFIHTAYEIVETLIRNPDAFIWLVRVKKTDEKAYYYLLRIVCWSLIFGRHLGLSKIDLRALALAALLKDVGSIHLSDDREENFFSIAPSANEGEQIIESTLKIIKQYQNIPPKVIKTIKMHREQLDGKGFPNGLKGDQIFLLSKILGVACYYDQVSYLQGKACSAVSSKAASRLYQLRGTRFQDDLVVEFIKAIGIYPTGTLVELTDGRVAVVTEQNYQRRLKPKVLVCVDAENAVLDTFEVVDLSTGAIDIARDVEPYDYPVKVTKVRLSHIEAHIPKKGLFGFFAKN